MNVGDLAVLVIVGAIFPGTEATEAEMRVALAELSRDDALFTCARVNAMVSGFGPNLTHHQRQEAAVGQYGSLLERWALTDYINRHGGPERVVTFFRGQMLELARWVALYAVPNPNDGETLLDPATRSSFFRAALIASGLWQQRLFPKVEPTLDRDKQLRQLLGSFRKSMEEGNLAAHPGLIMSRGWILFSRYMPQHMPEFSALFERSTGMSLRQYFICATVLINRTFVNSPEERIFKTDIFNGGTGVFQEIFRRFIGLLSQTPEEWAEKLRARPQDSGYLSLRERPILNFNRGRSIILDPFFYLDNLASAPLFYPKNIGISVTTTSAAFGYAFEDYAIEMLRRRFPEGTGVLYKPLSCNVSGADANGQEFEVDAILDKISSAAFIEIKATMIREETVLAEDPETFLNEIRAKYGYVEGSGEPGKGVAQLARSIGALVRKEWSGPRGEFAQVRHVYPILVVFDVRLAAPGCCEFLNTEFHGLLGGVPKGIQVHPLIVMTIDDLEHVISGVESLSLMDFIQAYSAADLDRTGSVHNFIAGSNYINQVRPSPFLEEAFDDLMQAVRDELRTQPDSPDAT